MRRQVILLERRGPSPVALSAAGERTRPDPGLMGSETALAGLRDSANNPDLDLVRRTLLEWHFYHDPRTDPASALRRPCLAAATPTLASEGGDLAAIDRTVLHGSKACIWPAGQPTGMSDAADLVLAGQAVTASLSCSPPSPWAKP